ncbi:MAG: inorganic phosphate transporter [Atopobiaceae bacterium]|nr:inorganic phosphate transporter [Atopobiaceae bacterium]
MTITLTALAGAIAANPVLLLIIALCLGATVVNGATDAPNAIATVVGTRAMRPAAAVLMAAVGNFIGLVVITSASSDSIKSATPAPPM